MFEAPRNVTEIVQGTIDRTDPSIEDTAYISSHLEQVEALLRDKPTQHLNADQRVRRAKQLDRLREYRLAGEFPINLDFEGLRVPYFRDARGTLCAMAYLIDESGDHSLVDRVAKSCNNAKVEDLTADAELVAWLAREGMTAEEAALVQPSYRVPSPGVRASWIVNDESINKVANDKVKNNEPVIHMGKAEAVRMGREVLGIREGQGGMWHIPQGYRSQVLKALIDLNKTGKLTLTGAAADALNALRDKVSPRVTQKFVPVQRAS